MSGIIDYARLDALDEVQSVFERECRLALRSVDEFERKAREMRIIRPDGMVCIPYSAFVGIDLAEVPRIVASYVQAFEDGVRAGQEGGR